jgi:pteridine reductase
MELQGKVALVTGAARRLGRVIALALAEAGADLVLHVHTSSGEDVAQAVRETGKRASIVRADLSCPKRLIQFVHQVFAQSDHIDILINNAAVFFPTPLGSLTVAAWRTVLHTNLTAPFALTLLLGREMRSQGWGRIIQLSDWSGFRPIPGYLPYCVAKGGINSLTQVMAKGLAPRVTVNSIALGPVLVPDYYRVMTRRALAGHTPLGRLGTPADVVRVVRFLVERGEFVTGATYFVDGGWMARAPNGTGTSL